MASLNTKDVEEMERKITSIDDEGGIEMWLAQEIKKKQFIDTVVHEGAKQAAQKMIKSAITKKDPKKTKRFNIRDKVLVRGSGENRIYMARRTCDYRRSLSK